jgi:hypothetical protein
MSEVAITWIRGSIVTVPEVASGYDAKSPDGRQRATLRSPECVFAITGVVDDFAVTAAGQVERIIAIAVVCTITCIMPIVVTVTAIVMCLDLRRTRSASERQRVIIVTAVALLPVMRVARIACVTVVARIEIHIASRRG